MQEVDCIKKFRKSTRTVTVTSPLVIVFSISPFTFESNSKIEQSFGKPDWYL